MKTYTEHTPAPWIVEECHNIDGSKFLTINGQGPHGAWLADIQAGLINGSPSDVTEKHRSNARLIAAAPELLRSLIEICGALEETSSGAFQTLADARAVIAKATSH